MVQRCAISGPGGMRQSDTTSQVRLAHLPVPAHDYTMNSRRHLMIVSSTSPGSTTSSSTSPVNEAYMSTSFSKPPDVVGEVFPRDGNQDIFLQRVKSLHGLELLRPVTVNRRNAILALHFLDHFAECSAVGRDVGESHGLLVG